MATRAEIAALKNLGIFVDRISICVAFFAQYVLGEDPKALNHNRRFNWAQNAILNPAGTAGQIATAVALDPTFANQPSPILDWTIPLNALPETGAGSLQASVENAINMLVLQF